MQEILERWVPGLITWWKIPWMWKWHLTPVVMPVSEVVTERCPHPPILYLAFISTLMLEFGLYFSESVFAEMNLE